MIELLTANTPNGKKISIMLEEINFEYKVTKININKDEQFKPEFINRLDEIIIFNRLSKLEINKILERCNCTFKQLPIIKRDDAIGKVLRIAPGDICEITRINDNSCESTYYRGCH